MHNEYGSSSRQSVASGAVPGGDLASLMELRPELEVLRHLGSGSTADVYLARETPLQRLVAIKVLRPSLLEDGVVSKRFEREGQAAARLNHPNVTGIYRVGRLSTGVPYIVMEFIEGRSLLDLLRVRGALPPSEGRSLLAAVASALAAVHEQGIVHRDLRPDNIFLDNRTGRPVITDFGIAARVEAGVKVGTQLTALGVLLGDPRYLSPEQVRGETATEASDVYAFGLLAYDVLAGRGPYPAATAADYLMAHLSQEPATLGSLVPLADGPWLRLLQQCLDKDPHRRPRAADLAASLVAAQDAGSTDGGNALEQFFREMKRRRVYQVLVGYGAAAIALLGTADAVQNAFALPERVYQAIVLLTLAGFPAAVGLSWVFDLSASGIRRTGALPAAAGASRVLAFVLAGCALLAAVIAWLLLRS